MNLHDWITISEFGKYANYFAGVIALHADQDLAFQTKVASLMESAFAKKETDGPTYALIFDRVATASLDPAQRKLQRYGTRGGCSNGQFVPFPMEDPSHINDRRKTAGLDTEEKYIADTSKMCAPQ